MPAGAGVNPAVWGPVVWPWLHALAALWDADADVSADCKVFAKAVGGLVNVLPCRSCREAFCEFFRILRPSLCEMAESRETSLWVWTLHDIVNQKLGKASPPLHRVPIGDPVATLWPAMRVFVGHYDDTGVANRAKVYRGYIESIAAVYAATGEPDAAVRLARVADHIRGRNVTAASLLAHLE